MPAPPLVPPLPRPVTPPHNGYGAEADTAYNWNRLVPRPNPHTDFRRWEALDGKVLRFAGRFARGDTRQQLFDADRQFVVRQRSRCARRACPLREGAGQARGKRTDSPCAVLVRQVTFYLVDDSISIFEPTVRSHLCVSS